LNENTIDSYLILEDDLLIGDLRLLTVDNPLFLPEAAQIRLIVTSTDVLHSFAIPSLGLKIDAIPGRLNQVTFKTPGFSTIIFGQCSELCGVAHNAMPIMVIVAG